MDPTSNLIPGVEALRHQYDRQLFTSLVDAFTRAMASGRVNSLTPELREIEAIVKEVTKITITLNIEDTHQENAWVFIPMVNENHSLLGWWKGVSDPKQVAKLFKGESEKYATAGVDYVKGQVFGAFEKLNNPIHLTSGLINSNKYTPEMVAAIFAHEVGHLWAFFAWFKRTVDMNHVLYETMMNFIGAADTEERLMVLRKAEKQAKIKINNKEFVAETNDPNLVPMVIVTGQPVKDQSGTGSYIHESRTFEAMADQFVSKIGGGLAAAKALELLLRNAGYNSYHSSFKYLVTETLSVISNVCLILVFSALTYGLVGIVFLYGFLMSVFSSKDALLVETYDRPGERIQRIKNELVDSLKNRDLPKSIRQNIVKEVEVITKILSTLKDRYTLYERFVIFLSKNRTREVNEMQQQKDLELLSNNGLYTATAKLDTLI
jgi:hypothetical protein